MLDFMDRRQKKAKQPHICRFCGKEVKPGQDYIRMCCSRKGRITTLSAHIPCDALSIAYGQAMNKQECSGTDVEAWIRGTVCYQCNHTARCTENPFFCKTILDYAIADPCVRRAVDEAMK